MKRKLSIRSESTRRVIRLSALLLNPLYLLLTILTIAAISSILMPPTPTWQYFIGLPVAALTAYKLLQAVIEAFLGEYERLVLRANMSVLKEDGTIAATIKTDFSAGGSLLRHYRLINKALANKGLTQLTSYCEDESSDQRYDCELIARMLNDIMEIALEAQEGKDKSKSIGLSREQSKFIADECNVLIQTADNAKEMGYKLCFTLLSQPAWNDATYLSYLTRGYCI